MPLLMGGGVAAAAGLGAWARWTVKPVVIAYYIGRQHERIISRERR